MLAVRLTGRQAGWQSNDTSVSSMCRYCCLDYAGGPGWLGERREILDGFIRVFLLSRLAGLRERVSYGRISSIDYMLNVLRNQGSLSLEGISVRYQRSFPHGGGPDPMMSRMGLARSPLPAPDAEPT